MKFMSETHIGKDPQPTAVTANLNGAIVAKLTYTTNGPTGAETWDVGRVRGVAAVSVTAPMARRSPTRTRS